MPTATEAGFFAAIRESPADDVPRLVYADWLEENGDELDGIRAEFIRTQICVAHTPKGSPGHADLIRRQLQLRDRLERTWLAPLRKIADSLDVRRGFVERVVVGAAQLIRHGPEIIRLAPVCELAVILQPADLPELVDCPHLGEVHSLEARDGPLGDGGARILGGCPHLTGLRTLLLHSCEITALGLADLLLADLSRLRVFNLGLNDIGEIGMGRLCVTTRLARLEKLSLGANRLYAPAARALARAAHLVNLVDVNLGANYLDDEAIEAIGGAAHLASLRRLDVRNNEFGVAGARALARSPYLSGLEFLEVSGNRIGNEGLVALRDRFGERLRA